MDDLPVFQMEHLLTRHRASIFVTISLHGTPQPKLQHLLLLVLRTEALWWLTVLAVLGATHTHHLGVDGSGHAVVHLAVDLGQGVACIGNFHRNPVRVVVIQQFHKLLC